MKRHLIYVPGLQDDKVWRTAAQEKCLGLWRLYGFSLRRFSVMWNDDEGFDGKLSRLVQLVDELLKDGGSVTLIGVSAGASLALNAFALRPKIASVLCICGKIQNPETVADSIKSEFPSFPKSLKRLHQHLPHFKPEQLRRVASAHPLVDLLVPVPDTKIPGVREITLPSFGHAFTIFFALTFASPVLSATESKSDRAR